MCFSSEANTKLLKCCNQKCSLLLHSHDQKMLYNSHDYGLYSRRYKNPSNPHPKKKTHKSIKRVADTMCTPPSHFLHLNFQSFLPMSPCYHIFQQDSLSTVPGFHHPKVNWKHTFCLKRLNIHHYTYVSEKNKSFFSFSEIELLYFLLSRM